MIISRKRNHWGTSIVFFIVIITTIVVSYVLTTREDIATVDSEASGVPVSGETGHLPLETGGTNFVVYDLSQYGVNPTDETWPTLKFVLSNYHEAPNLVKRKLQNMCNNGQKKVTYIMYFMHWGTEGRGTVPSRGGTVYPQLEKNIRNIFLLTSNLKNEHNQECFNEVQFRFRAIGGTNDPKGWTKWEENYYQENKSFIYNVRSIIKDVMKNKPQKVVFDLGLELGGTDKGQAKEYTGRLWKEYTNDFGTVDTYGFSIAWVKGNLLRLYETYKSIGKYPSEYAVSIYESIDGRASTYDQLVEISNELEQVGQKPVLIQEVFTNNKETFDAIKKARNLGMNIRAVMQWQKTKDKWLRPDGKTRRSFSTIGEEYIYHSLIPSGLKHVCSTNGKSVTLSWDLVPQASDFSFRLDYNKNNSGTDWNFPKSTDIRIDNHKQNFYKGEILPNELYRWWIHTNVNGKAATSPISTQLKCDGVGGVPTSTPTSTNVPRVGNSTGSSSPSQLGDFDKNNIIDIRDFNLFVEKYRESRPEADLNKDGKVNISDFTVFLNSYKDIKK